MHDTEASKLTLERTSTSRKMLVLALLLVGVVLWNLTVPILGWTLQLVLLGVAAVLAIVPQSAEQLCNRIDALRHPPPVKRRWIATGCFLAAALYLPVSAFNQGRVFAPQWHDHQMYLIQMHQMAVGKLSMPQHALADFFETFHFLVKPVYASMYFPGAALLYTPSIWLDLPYSLMPILVAASVALLVFLVISELIDCVAGMLAVLCLLALTNYRHLSIHPMSHMVVTLFGLLMVWAWLQWRKEKKLGWMALMGVAAGWAAITRPVDTLSYAIPLGILVLIDLWRSKQPARRWLATLGVGVATACPFIALQLTFNQQVTGSIGTNPTAYYNSYYWGIKTYGLQTAEDARDYRVNSQLPQMQMFGEDFVLPEFRAHTAENYWGLEHGLPTRLRYILAFGLPAPMLLSFMPVGLLALHDRRRWLFAVQWPLHAFLYSLFASMSFQYWFPVAPAIVLMVLMGITIVQDTFGRLRPALVTFTVLGAAALCIGNLPDLNGRGGDDTFIAQHVTILHHEVPQHLDGPAVVFVRFHVGPDRRLTSNPHDEPVYNYDVAWPDDAPVVYVHDLGPRDIEVIEYYRKIQPERTFYLFDRFDNTLYRLGTADEILNGPVGDEIRASTAPSLASPTTQPAKRPGTRIGQFIYGEPGIY